MPSDHYTSIIWFFDGVPMRLGTCKFCRNERALVRAHIIPEALFPRDEKGSRLQYVLDGNGERPRSKLPSGDYDPNLVCRQCEDRFHTGDDYAKRFLVDGRNNCRRIAESVGSALYEYSDVDYRKLKLFFVSLLWRAHATSLRAFEKVVLPTKYEAMARKMIANQDPGPAKDFGVIIIRIADGPLVKMGASPTPREIPPNKIQVFDALIFGYLALVKVDQRRYPKPFLDLQLEPGRPLLMVEQAIERTPYHRFAIDAVVQAQATAERLRSRRTS